MADIVLKDRNGNNIEYPGVNHIKVKTTDGATKDFLVRTPVETTVDLDFSGGAMEVNPESEELFSKVNIPVPANLIPENIAEGVDIAGIIGALSAGKNVVVNGGVFWSKGEDVYTLNHGLGVTPDVFFLYNSGLASGAYASGTYRSVRMWLGMSTAFYNLVSTTGNSHVGLACAQNDLHTMDILSGSAKLEATTSFSFANSADAEKVLLGSVNYRLLPGTNKAYYRWIAIGGLT